MTSWDVRPCGGAVLIGLLPSSQLVCASKEAGARAANRQIPAHRVSVRFIRIFLEVLPYFRCKHRGGVAALSPNRSRLARRQKSRYTSVLSGEATCAASPASPLFLSFLPLLYSLRAISFRSRPKPQAPANGRTFEDMMALK